MNWQDSTLGALTKLDGGLIQTGPFGSQLHQAEYETEGVPVVMPKDITDGGISSETVARVSEQTAARLERHKLKPRSIVLPRRGEITKRAFITDAQGGWLCGTGCLKIELNGDHLVPEYLYYFMGQEHVTKWLMQHAVGSTMLNLSAGIVAAMPVRYPAINVQKAIARTLSTYDDLIENNRRRMALLEDSARQLYREWFVRLRFPGHEHTPIVDGLPQGWERKTLGEISGINQCNIASGFDGEIEYIDIASVTRNSVNDTTRYEFRDAPGRARRIVRHGDIIWSCVRPNRRSHAVIWQPAENLVASTGFVVISPKSLPTSFLYQAVTTDLFVGYLENHAKGAAYPAVVSGDFERATILVPPPALVTAFDEFAEPLLWQIQNLHSQNQKLRQARDLLLPRLMNGELAV
ncbi:MAG: restriction endonuclease subunit S [Limnohabitans sp.]|nr:MAG: restriction endonuclease subunit S [Limnohabitans sp.]